MLEGEFQLRWIQNFQDDHVMTTVSQVAQPGQHILRITQQVAEDEHDTASGESLCQVMQGLADPGLSGLCCPFQQLQQDIPLRRMAGRTDQLVNSIRNRGQCHSCQAPHIFQRAEGRLRTLVSHAGTHIQHQVADQVGLILVLLDIELVGAGKQLPVEVTGIVPGGVIAVLGEFHREATQRATV